MKSRFNPPEGNGQIHILDVCGQALQGDVVTRGTEEWLMLDENSRQMANFVVYETSYGRQITGIDVDDDGVNSVRLRPQDRRI